MRSGRRETTLTLARVLSDDELSSGLMIECEMCNCWQHGPCVGLWDEKVRSRG